MVKLIAFRKIFEIIFHLCCILSIGFFAEAADEFTAAPVSLAPIENANIVSVISSNKSDLAIGNLNSILSKLIEIKAIVFLQMTSMQKIMEGDSLGVFISAAKERMEFSLNFLLEEENYAIATLIISVMNQTLIDQTLHFAMDLEAYVSEDIKDDIDLNTLGRTALDNVAPQLVLVLKATKDFQFNSLTSVVTVDETMAPTLAPTKDPLSFITTSVPTDTPSNSPTLTPITFPSIVPSTIITGMPTNTPMTSVPTNSPTLTPTLVPTLKPIDVTQEPSDQITFTPTEFQATKSPTVFSTRSQSIQLATREPTVSQVFIASPTTSDPTNVPTILPTFPPTILPTSTPTRTPTKVPTGLTTKAPTKVPTKAPTEVITMAPTTRALSFFSLKLSPVARGMTFQTAETFRRKAEQFLKDRFLQLERPITIMQVQMLDNRVETRVVTNTRRRRSLQELTLIVEMSIQGNYIPKSKDEVVDLSKIALNFFETGALTFINMLQGSGENADAIYFANIESLVPVKEMNLSSTPSPQSTPRKVGGLSMGAVIGVAICGVLLLALVSILLMRQSRNKSSRRMEPVRANRNNEVRHDAPPRNRLSLLTPGKKKKPQTAQSQTTGQSTQSESLQPQRLVNRISGGVSSERSNFEGDSVLFSDMNSQNNEQSTLAGGDNMSYAYSLDHGIDPSLSSGNTDYYTQNSYQAAGGGGGATHLPTEIPMMGAGAKK